MIRPRLRHWSLLWLIVLHPIAAAGQPVQQDATFTHKLAGLGAGVTASAIVLSLDEVLGSSCFGSGSYLKYCRVGYVAAAAAAGGLGALVGTMVKTEEPGHRATRVLVGSALGSMGAFLVSNLTCEQERSTNPELLCGYDGMVTTRAALGGAVLGGLLGAFVGGGSEELQVRQLGAVPRGDGGVGVGATLSWRPR